MFLTTHYFNQKKFSLEYYPAAIIAALYRFCFAAQIDSRATTVLIILLVVLLIFSFAVSGAQVAFFSLTNKDVNLLKTKPQPAYQRIINLLENPKALLASLWIANTFAAIAIIVITNLIIDEVLNLKEMSWGWIAAFFVKVLVVTSILILFAEILPKMYARHNNIRFAKDFGPIVEGVFYLFNRMGNWFVKYSDLAEHKINKNKSDELSDEELENTGSEEERNILKGIEKFGNITVKQIMRTRLDVSGVDYKISFAQLLKSTEELEYSRIPVYKEDLDDITGMIHTKDILPYIDKPADYDWHALMRPPYFVHEYKMIEDLLREFQSKRIHFAVVVDEFGGTSGIVTLEDIMEEIIGDIKDEFDEDDNNYKKLDENNYIFEGKTMVYDVCKAMQLHVNTFDKIKGESDSLAGLVLEVAGEIPKLNQVLISGDFQFTVLEIEKNRLQKIKVTIKQ
jgi:gliding motility-associated protein GldE